MNVETYVQIKDPSVLRRDVLRNALDTTRLLKSYEEYKVRRKRRMEKMRALKIMIVKLQEEISVLHEKYLPSLKEKVEIRKKKNIHPVQENKIDSSLEKLQRELSDIEEKLQKL